MANNKYQDINKILGIINASGQAQTMADPMNPNNIIKTQAWTQEENISNILKTNHQNRKNVIGYEIAEIDLTSGNIYYSHSNVQTQSSDNRVLLSYLSCKKPSSSVSYVSSLIDTVNQKYKS